MSDWMNQMTQWKTNPWKNLPFWVTHWHDLICKHILSKSKRRGQIVHISLQLKCSINVYPFFFFHTQNKVWITKWIPKPLYTIFFAILLISSSPFWIWALNFSFPKGRFRLQTDYSLFIWDCSEIWDQFKLWKCPPRAADIPFLHHFLQAMQVSSVSLSNSLRKSYTELGPR